MFQSFLQFQLQVLKVAGVCILLVVGRGHYYALDARCGHRGGPLEEGKVGPKQFGTTPLSLDKVLNLSEFQMFGFESLPFSSAHSDL